MPLRGFYSYAPQDEAHRTALTKHLASLRRQGFEPWHEQELIAGDDREAQLARRFEEADLILLLISPDFMGSDTCHAQMVRALERQKRGEARVLPIFVRPVDLDGTPLEQVSLLPSNAKPVVRWDDCDEAWLEVARGIRAAVEALETPEPDSSPAPRTIKVPVSSGLAEAVSAYKRARAEDSRIRRLDLSRLAGIARGHHETELDLLDFVVSPSLHDETEEDVEQAAALRSRLRQPELEPTLRHELNTRLAQLQDARWDHHGGRRDWWFRPVSFAEALHRHRRMTVIGDPGAGKSVLTRLAFLACVEGTTGDRARALLRADDGFNRAGALATRMLEQLLPVRLTLGEYGEDVAKDGGLSLQAFVHRRLREQGARPALLNGLVELLSAGKLFLLCDGLDEVAEEHRRRVVDEVSGLMERYPAIRLLVTSRPHGYRPRVPGIAHTRLALLHSRQKRRLVSRLHYLIETQRRPDARGVERARQRTSALLFAIATRDEWDSLSNNPLLLTLSALTPTQEDGVPRHQVFVFENFVRTLLGEWREVLTRSPIQPEMLLEVWSEVAFELVKQEQRHGVMRALMLQRLASALTRRAAPPSFNARTALALAIEMGLVREEAETVAFWHSTFAEFLAARALSGDEVTVTGAAARLLAEANLPSLVLELAAARLDHVLCARDELDALVDGLLARDDVGSGRLLRPGLRAISGCIASGVNFDPVRVERVWTAWAEMLERAPISPLWDDFGHFAKHAPTPRLSARLATRFACIPDRGVKEARDGLARVVAPSALGNTAVREACAHWMGEQDTPVKQLGAFGLASAGEWSDTVIEALGRFAVNTVLSHLAVREVVRRGGALVLTRLKEHIAQSSALDMPEADRQEEARWLRDLRHSAAYLLAIAGAWDDAVADVVKHALVGRYRAEEAESVMELIAGEPPVTAALLVWLRADSRLGRTARDIVRRVAPRIEGLPEAILELTAGAEARLLMDLENLLSSIGEERRTLTDTLYRWLEDWREERRMCAARVLRRLSHGDDRLHEALRQGMRTRDDAVRVRWAEQALGLAPELSELALVTMLGCARSPEKAVRQIVHKRMPDWMRETGWKHIDGWIACAEDRDVPAAARLDAAMLLAYGPSGRALTESILRDLIETEDQDVRLQAALQLIAQKPTDTRAAVVAAEILARSGLNAHQVRLLPRVPVSAPAVVEAVLRELPMEASVTVIGEPPYERLGWSSLLRALAATDSTCVGLLLGALARPGLAGDVAEDALRHLRADNALLRKALTERLEHAEAAMMPGELLRLVSLGLSHEDTKLAAITASRRLDPDGLTQEELYFLSWGLHDAGANEDAARWGRLMLDSENLKLVLQAAETLAIKWEHEGASDWIRSALPRLFASATPWIRLDAGRLAMECGILEQESLAVLQGCLELAGTPYDREPAFDLLWGDDEPMAGLSSWPARIDFGAMHALCHYRPDIGLPRLAEWLEDAELARFSQAAGILAKRDDQRERVRLALEKRLRSGPEAQLHLLARAVEEHGFAPAAMFEQVLMRYISGQHAREVRDCLMWWLSERPDLWPVIRQQEPISRRSLFRNLLWREMRLHPDAIVLAVEVVLLQKPEIGRRMMHVLERWCRPPDPMEVERRLSRGAPPLEPPEVVRGWLREALIEQVPPDDLRGLLWLDRLMELGEMPGAQRIAVLRRATALDLSTFLHSEEERILALDLQAVAARRLLALGGNDARTPHILEAAVHEFARDSMSSTFQAAKALLTLRPGDEALRHSLHQAVVMLEADISLDEVLAILAQAGFSNAGCADVLIERLRAPDALERHETETLEFLDALNRVEGVSEQRRAEVLIEFVSIHDSRLPDDLKVQLARRAELPDAIAAKLLLNVLAQRGGVSRGAGEQWLARFASTNVRAREAETFWWPLGPSDFVLSHLRWLDLLAGVDKPERMEELIAEVAAVPSGEFLALYRRSRSNTELTMAEWNQLVDWLSVNVHDSQPQRFAKDWLTLRLWQVAEPSRLSALLRS
ncbi:TIR domain-containing protein [Pyxidicoccus sp. 3LFB2]